MPSPLDTLDLQRLRREELPALAQWDRRGLFPAPGENGEAFAQRLLRLQERLRECHGSLKEKGLYSLEGLSLKREAQVPPALLEEAGERTRRLYGFQGDWVPAFFLTPGMGWLFGGCTYSWPPDPFAVFIINERLRDRKRSFLYCREEILAHELCHVARGGLDSQRFEEHFAYQTSHSAFRRNWGGIMHSQTDSFLFLGACLLLLLGQFTLPLLAPQLPLSLNLAPHPSNPTPPAPPHPHTTKTFQKALDALAHCCGEDRQKARILLFHATDTEIHALARAQDPALLLDKWRQKCLRWKVACYRTGRLQEFAKE